MLSKDYYFYIFYINLYSTLIPIFISVLKWRNLEKSLRLFSFNLMLVFGLMLLSDILSRFKIHNSFLSTLQVIKDIILMSLIYSPLLNKALYMQYALFIAYIVSFLLVLEGFFTENFLGGYMQTVEAVIVSIIAVIFLKQRLLSEKYLNPIKNPMFWITMGVVINNATSIISSIFLSDMQEYTQEVFYQFWNFFSFISIIVNILFTVGYFLVPNNDFYKQKI